MAVGLPGALVARLEALSGARVVGVVRLRGGDVNRAVAVELDDGRSLFVKWRRDAAPGEFASEAAGLAWLRVDRGLPLPEVRGYGDPEDGEGAPGFLALEFVQPGRVTLSERELGSGLARIHLAGAAAHCAPAPGASRDWWWIGRLRLPLPAPGATPPSWSVAYAEHRLRPLLGIAENRSLTAGCRHAVEGVCERIGELAGPEEPPSRLHGDLWTGNIQVGHNGRPWLIDPAASGGHREVDLAMLELFGTPGPGFFDAYRDVAGLDRDYPKRRALWQIMPLLVHAALFGGGYGVAAERAARAYL